MEALTVESVLTVKTDEVGAVLLNEPELVENAPVSKYNCPVQPLAEFPITQFDVVAELLFLIITQLGATPSP